MARQFKLPDLTGFATTTALNSAVAALPQYVGNGAWMTRAQLKASFPAGVDQLGKLARVTDLWTNVRTTMICEYDATGSGQYYWRPQRTDYAIPVTQASGNYSLLPLITPPSLIFKTTLIGNIVATPTTNEDVWPGCFFDIQAPAALGLFTFTLTGLVGGLTSMLLGGNRKRVVYTRDGWEAS